jgi:hypothetical protein
VEEEPREWMERCRCQELVGETVRVPRGVSWTVLFVEDDGS